MTIVDGAVRRFAMPLAETYVSATARHDVREVLLLELVTSDGTLGLGEAAPLSNRTERLDATSRALLKGLKTLTEREPEPERALDRLDAWLPGGARTPTARFALEQALVDLLSRQADEPLAAWLASRHGTDPASAVPVNATVPAQADAEATRERVEAALDAGFTTLKLKGTGDDATDLARVQAARDVAPGAELRLDVNGSWSTIEAALERLDALEPYELAYVEQPLPPDQLEAMARLRSEASTPIAADEPVTSPGTARHVLEAGAADVLVLKPMVLGGLNRALEIAADADEHGVPVVVTSTIDGAVARAGALHAAAALPSAPLACGLATGGLLDQEPARFEERIEDGRLHVPETPGLGCERTDMPEVRRWRMP